MVPVFLSRPNVWYRGDPLDVWHARCEGELPPSNSPYPELHRVSPWRGEEGVWQTLPASFAGLNLIDTDMLFLYHLTESAPVMKLVDMRVLGTRAFSVSVRVRPGAEELGKQSLPKLAFSSPSGLCWT